MTIQINLPDTTEVRAILLQLGGHLADDMVAHYEGLAEDEALIGATPDLTDGVPKGTTPAAMGAAASMVNDAFLRAMGLG